MPRPPPLELFLNPSETPRILAYLADHETPSPAVACKAFGVSFHTWYRAVANLEALGLIFAERGPPKNRMLRVTITQNGRGALRLMSGFPDTLKGSRAALEWEIESGVAMPGSREAGEVLCKLIDLAERRGDQKALKAVEALAATAQRPGEAALASAVGGLLTGDSRSTVAKAEASLPALEKEGNTRSYRRALFFHAVGLNRVGERRKAFDVYTRLRQLSIRAGDAASEADARVAYGIYRSSQGHMQDAVQQFTLALKAAKNSGTLSKEAKVLTNLGLAEGYLDPPAGLARLREAQAAAEKCGARVLLVHIHANNALLYAVQNEPGRANAALRVSRFLAGEVGHELGPTGADAWYGVVRRILRHHRLGTPFDWRAQVLALLQKAPSPEAVERRKRGPERRGGRGRGPAARRK